MSKELPGIDELRASQRKGAEGKGTATETYNEVQACFNMGTGVEVAETTDADYEPDTQPWM